MGKIFHDNMAYRTGLLRRYRYIAPLDTPSLIANEGMDYLTEGHTCCLQTMQRERGDGGEYVFSDPRADLVCGFSFCRPSRFHGFEVGFKRTEDGAISGILRVMEARPLTRWASHEYDFGYSHGDGTTFLDFSDPERLSTNCIPLCCLASGHSMFVRIFGDASLVVAKVILVSQDVRIAAKARRSVSALVNGSVRIEMSDGVPTEVGGLSQK